MAHSLTFPVQGLNCASCSVRAQTALEDIKGVRAAHVNFATGLADVEMDAGLPAAVLAEALEQAGKPALPATLRLNVDGMSCASCVGRVETALRDVNGVLSAQVNLATGQAEVRGLGITHSNLIAAVAATGKSATALIEGADHAPAIDHDSEATGLKRYFLIAAALTLPVFILEMGGHAFPAFHHLIARTIGMQTSWLIQFALTVLVILWPGRQLWRSGLRALLRWQPDMNALVVLGSGAAFSYSTLTLLAPSLLPEAARSVYFEAAAVIITLILAGRWMEARAKGRTGSAITRLIALRPATATVVRGNEPVEIAIENIVLGDVIQVRPGERISVDGTVLDGESWVNESMLTGEPVPTLKSSGALVSAGTLNEKGSFTFEARAIGADTTLSQIIDMVQKAQNARLPVQDLVNKITAWFVPAVLAIALCTVLVWLVFGPDPKLTHALVAGVSVLIIACPCAMGLATPTSIMVGTGRAADIGVLFAKGAALQELQGIQTVAFDKTGTLTIGRPTLSDIKTAEAISPKEGLAIAAAAEARSEHPIARALVQGALERELTLPEVDAFESVTGGGVRAQVSGKSILIGNRRLLHDAGVETPIEDGLGTEVLMAIDGHFAARFEIDDPIKPSAAQAITQLKQRGIEPVMITGDTESAARAVAAQLGITAVVAGVLPNGKADEITQLQRSGRVAFVGDGINDAPALAQSDVGIAIGTGTDVAIEAADVVLLAGDPNGVASAFEISAATLRNIRQNLFWAFGYNAALIPVAAGVLYPAFGLTLSPALAAGAMALSSVFVLMNALRLNRAGLSN